LCIFYINKNIALNIKRKCQDFRDLSIVNADDKAIESLLYNDRAGNNFNLNGLTYVNAYNYLVLDNISNTPADIYKF